MKFIFLVGLGLFVSCILFGCNNSPLDDPKTDESSSENQPSGDNASGDNTAGGDNSNNDNSSGDSSGGNTTPSKPITGEEGSKKVLFNLEGATALATSENESRAYYGVRAARTARAANSSDNLGILAKVLSDGSLESVIESDYDVTFPPIKYIMQSPSQTNKQLYLIFPDDVRSDAYWKRTFYDENGNIIGTTTNGEWLDGAYNWNEEWVDGEVIMGQLVCVYPDGSYVNILSNKDGVQRNLEELEEPIVFDDWGYMYYIAYEYVDKESTRIIYRYNPATKQSEQLTLGMKNYSYSKMQVSNDGSYLFVQGRNDNNNSSFLKAIPVGSPNSAQDLLFSSDGWLNTGDWLYDDESDVLYVTTDVQGKQGLLRFTKNSSGYFTGDSYKNLSNPIQEGSGEEEDGYPYNNYLENNLMGSYYTWRVEHLDSNGKVDVEKVIEYIVACINNRIPTKDDGYKYITASDIDIRFDNPELAKCTDREYYGYNCKSLVNDMKGLKNGDAIRALTSQKLGLLYEMTWANRYKDYGNNTYRYCFLADILYLKGTNTLLCDDPDYKHFAMSSNGKYFSNYDNPFNWSLTTQINTPKWNDSYYTADGELNCSKILDYFYSFSMIESDKANYEFRLNGLETDEELDIFYSELTNENAVDYISSDAIMISEFYSNFNGSEYYSNDRYLPRVVKFIAKTCFVKGTDKSIISIKEGSSSEEDSTYYPSWGGVSNLTLINGQLWGIEGADWSEPKILCLLDGDTYVGKVPSALKDFRIKNIQLNGKNLYFKNLILDSTGGESGKQDIRRYEIENDAVVNLFERLPGRDSYTIETMSIAEPNLYVCLSQGLTVTNFRIDTETRRAETLATSEKFKQIISFRM